MASATQNNERLLTWQRAVVIVSLLIALGILITPVQWYIAYVGFQREKQQRKRQTRGVESHQIASSDRSTGRATSG